MLFSLVFSLLFSTAAAKEPAIDHYAMLKNGFVHALKPARPNDFDLAGEAPTQACWLVQQSGRPQPFRLVRIEQILAEATGPLLPEDKVIKVGALWPAAPEAEKQALLNDFTQIEMAYNSIETQMEIHGARSLFQAPTKYKLRKHLDYILFEVKVRTSRHSAIFHYGYCHSLKPQL